MRAIVAASTELFVGTEAAPRQVLQVTLDGIDGEAEIVVRAEGISGGARTRARVTDVGLEIRDAAARVGEVLLVHVEATDRAGSTAAGAELTVAEPGWTMHLISHFHYDPVWWATQAAYAVTWNDADELARRFQMSWQQPGFTLIDTHLELTRRDPDYKFVLAEVDLIKPYWDARPEQRAYLRRLLAEGRLELLGGTYNEPNTNLTSAETTIRNFVHGAAFQRDVVGADPQTAWQLDAFGHDPQFPGLAADAGVSSSSWARGPFRPWGPMLTAYLPGAEGWGDPTSMQFASEFEWIAPSGRGLLTHYMPAHYSAGWVLDRATNLPEAEAALLELFTALKQVAATRNVLLPVGTDYTPPNRWITDVHRHWNATYVWPRFVCAVPSEFFTAVRAELAATGRVPSPQSRDMNPVFTGKEVSYIDTKQAHRAAETTLVDAEKFATLAGRYGAGHPHAALDKAWRHLVYGAHHDAVTGSESDQVYLDLLTTWHEALDLAQAVRDDALAHLCARQPPTAGGHPVVTVFNASSWRRDDVVVVTTTLPEGFDGVVLRPFDSAGADSPGADVPALVEVLDRHPDGSVHTATLTFVAGDVPGLGYRSWTLHPSASTTGWTVVTGDPTIESDRYRVTVDPLHGGAVSAVVDRRDGRKVVPAGTFGNALLRSDEYAEHPTFNEGPWHLLPTGRTRTSADAPADRVQVMTSPVGSRIVVDGHLEDVSYTQVLTLWNGVDRLDCRTDLHGFAGTDQLFRIRWPADVAGGIPVSEVGHAVIGRGHALIDVDSADHPWTLDNPAYGFFGLSSTAGVRVTAPDGGVRRAFTTAEIVAPGNGERDLAVALVRAGVTATSSAPLAPRYGDLAVDSNLPDVRISVGRPEENVFTAAVLDLAPEHAVELAAQLERSGTARVWVPAHAALAEVWQPSADLRGVRELPVLLVAGDDAVAGMVRDLDDDAWIDVEQAAPAGDGAPDLDDHTVAIANRGTPGFAVDTAGALHLSLLRSCSGWPTGVWIDPPVRTAPDGSAFALQHWSHAFEYSLFSGPGDWRSVGAVRHAHDVNHRLVARVHAGGDGTLPATVGLLDVRSDGEVVVSAVKVRGNGPHGDHPAVRADETTVRLYEATGRPARARITLAGGVVAARRVDLVERDSDDGPPASVVDGAAEVDLAPGETATLALRFGPPPGAPAPDAPATGVEPVFVEPFQPVFSRYWLNNTGVAPAGNLPVAVHLDADSVVVDAGRSVTLAATVASTAPAPVEGRLDLIVPAGWAVVPPDREYALDADAHLRADVVVTPPAGTPPGCYLVHARIEHGGQRVEDVCRVLVGGAVLDTVEADLLEDAVVVAPGGRATVTALLATTAASDLPAQVQLITPWDCWDLVAGWNTGAVVPARGGTQVVFDVDVPLDATPGRWWVLVKVAAAGRVRFTRSVPLEVRAG